MSSGQMYAFCHTLHREREVSRTGSVTGATGFGAGSASPGCRSQVYANDGLGLSHVIRGAGWWILSGLLWPTGS